MNQKAEFALRAFRSGNFRELCREYGISTKTGYKWKARFVERGLEGLEELSRRPLRSAGGLEESVVCEIVRLKQRRPSWGARKLRTLYLDIHKKAPSESSFKRVLERAGLTEKRLTRTWELSGRLRERGRFLVLTHRSG